MEQGLSADQLNALPLGQAGSLSYIGSQRCGKVSRFQSFIELFAPGGYKAKLHSHTTFLMNKPTNK